MLQYKLVKSPFVTMSKQIEYYPAQRGCERCPLGAQAGQKSPQAVERLNHIGTIYEAVFFLPNSSGLHPTLDVLVSGTLLVWVALDFDQCPGGAKVHTLD